MATTTTHRQMETGSKQSVDAQEKIQKLRELFADAPELGKRALENVIRELKSEVSQGNGRAWRAPAGSAPVSARSRS